MTIGSRIGDPVATRTSHLVQSKSVTGEPVVRLDRNCDDKDTRWDSALVTRVNQHADWKPVRNVAELETFLASASEDDKRNNLGQWKDKREWVFWSPDGQIQPREVKTMWEVNLYDKARLHSRAEEPDPVHGGPLIDAAYYVRLDPGTAAVKDGKYEEQIVVSDSYITRTTEWAKDGPHWIPMGFKHSEFHLFK